MCMYNNRKKTMTTFDCLFLYNLRRFHSRVAGYVGGK